VKNARKLQGGGDVLTQTVVQHTIFGCHDFIHKSPILRELASVYLQNLIKFGLNPAQLLQIKNFVQNLCYPFMS